MFRWEDIIIFTLAIIVISIGFIGVSPYHKANTSEITKMEVNAYYKNKGLEKQDAINAIAKKILRDSGKQELYKEDGIKMNIIDGHFQNKYMINKVFVLVCDNTTIIALYEPTDSGYRYIGTIKSLFELEKSRICYSNFIIKNI